MDAQLACTLVLTFDQRPVHDGQVEAHRRDRACVGLARDAVPIDQTPTEIEGLVPADLELYPGVVKEQLRLPGVSERLIVDAEVHQKESPGEDLAECQESRTTQRHVSIPGAVVSLNLGAWGELDRTRPDLKPGCQSEIERPIVIEAPLQLLCPPVGRDETGAYSWDRLRLWCELAAHELHLLLGGSELPLCLLDGRLSVVQLLLRDLVAKFDNGRLPFGCRLEGCCFYGLIRFIAGCLPGHLSWECGGGM